MVSLKCGQAAKEIGLRNVFASAVVYRLGKSSITLQ